jgi:hypothetical protein
VNKLKASVKGNTSSISFSIAILINCHITSLLSYSSGGQKLEMGITGLKSQCGSKLHYFLKTRGE